MTVIQISQSKSWTSGRSRLCWMLLLGFLVHSVFSSVPDVQDVLQKSDRAGQKNKRNALLVVHEHPHRRIKDATNSTGRLRNKKSPPTVTPILNPANSSIANESMKNSTEIRNTTNFTDPAGGAPASDDHPAHSPVQSPKKDTGPPAAASLPKNITNTLASPAKVPSAANASVTPPTTTSSPTVEAGTDAPTKSPVAAPAAEPTDSQVIEPTESPDSDDDNDCGPSTCDSCQQLAETLRDDGAYTCWWDEDKKACEKVRRDEHEGESMCGRAGSKPENKPVSPPPPTKPTSPPVKKDTDIDGDWGAGDDGGSFVLMILGLVAMLVVLIILIRKLCSSQIMASGGIGGVPAQGKYQGVALSDAEDDEEWGWDDTPKQSSVEMSNVRSPPAGNQALHFRSNSPRSSGIGSLDSSRGLPVKTAPSQPVRKGLNVRRAGMKNPMKQQQQQQPASTTHRLQPPAPIVRKTAEKLPSTDDFFEEMGFSAAKPKLGAAPAATGLSATALSVSSEDLGGGDEWDDTDLDDLLKD